MATWTLLQSDPKPLDTTVEAALDGHLCRCTGYRPILDAMQSFAVKTERGPCGAECSTCPDTSCSKAGGACGDVEDMIGGKCCSSAGYRKIVGEPTRKYDPAIDSERRKYPDALARRLAAAATATAPNSVAAGVNGRMWASPSSIDELLYLYKSFKASGKEVVLVAGNSKSGIYPSQDPLAPVARIFLKTVQELTQLNVSAANNEIVFGSAVTIADMYKGIQDAVEAYPGPSTSSFPHLLRHMDKVASVAVRNLGTWAGNFMLEHQRAGTPDPFQSDLVTIFMTAGCTMDYLELTTGERGTIPLDGFNNLDMAGKLLLALHLPFSVAGEHLETEKVMQRHQNSHAIITSGLRLVVGSAGVITSATLVYGGVWTTCRRAPRTEAALVGAPLTDGTLQAALKVLPIECVPDPSQLHSAYRSALVCSVFFKLFSRIAQPGSIPPFIRPVSTGVSTYPAGAAVPGPFPIHQAIPSIASKLHATGESQFVDDRPFTGFYAAVLQSTIACGKLEGFDIPDNLEGFVDLVTAKDVPGVNQIAELSPTVNDEELFASSDVIYKGQCLGLVLADSYVNARAAAKKINIRYSQINRPIVGIAAAKAVNSSFAISALMGGLDVLAQGDFATHIKDPGLSVLSGKVCIGNQYAFYMENQVCSVTPTEDGTLLVHASTQAPQDMSQKMSQVLGIGGNAIEVQMLRSGGGFGTKGSRSEITACAAAVAAWKHRRPVKIYLDKTADFEMIGKRHIYETEYEVGFTPQGVITALSLTTDTDGGCTYDETTFSLGLGQLTCDNIYNIPNFVSTTRAWKTNTPSNTSVRAPGAVQAIFVLEAVIEIVARHLGVDPLVVQKANFYAATVPPQLTPYGQPIIDYTFPRLWDDLLTSSAYAERLAAAQAFNAANKWTKRGIYAMPLKYGIGGGGVLGCALVDIYCNDGSVRVSHGACEIGQGCHTKVAQAVAATLGCPMDLVKVYPTSTVTGPNPTQTGGSVSSNLNAEAAIQACNEINKRLAPVRAAMGNPTWPQLILTASASGVNLQASSVSIIAPGSGQPSLSVPAPVHPRLGVVNMPRSHIADPAVRAAAPPPFNYCSYGGAVTEVELDVLTGQYQVLRADVTFDLGASFNPLIDLGQMQGGFIFGLGHVLTEEVITQDDGTLLTNSLWQYKPPSSTDIPIDFRCTILPNRSNPAGTANSKSVAEPPVCLAASAFFALKMAVGSVRQDQGIAQKDFIMNAPATVDNTLLSCGISPSSFTLSK